MVSLVVWKERSASAGSGRQSVNKLKPARPRFNQARAIPGSMERAIVVRTQRLRRDVRGQVVRLHVSAPNGGTIPRMLYLASMGVHFTALSAGSLAGEQIAQPLDVLPGDFWAAPAALRLGVVVRVVAVRLAVGAGGGSFLAQALNSPWMARWMMPNRCPAGLRMPWLLQRAAHSSSTSLPQRASTCCNATLAPLAVPPSVAQTRAITSPSARACAVVRIH